MKAPVYLRVILITLLSCLSLVLQAEQKKLFNAPGGGVYALHYSAVPTSFLEPDIAQRYDIVRSRSMGLVNIALIHENSEGQSKAIDAIVQGSVKNELRQPRQLSFIKVTEGDAKYHLAQLQFREGELLTFTIEVFPQGETTPLKHQFSHSFFND